MNTARLKSLIENLLKAEGELKIQERLAELQAALSRLANEPQKSDAQVEVSNR